MFEFLPGWAWLLIGLFAGANVGAFVMAACVVAGDADRRNLQ